MNDNSCAISPRRACYYIRLLQLFVADEKRLDILVNNAGVMGFPKKEVTKEGFEKHFGVNYLGIVLHLLIKR